MRCIVAFTWFAVASAAFGQDAKDKQALPVKRKPAFTVGKETTFVTSPLDAEGRVDYEAAINEILGKGVTPDNNAIVLLLKAIGPGTGKEKLSAEFFRLLKAAVPPEQGDYFVPYYKFCQDRKIDAGPFVDRLDESAVRAWTARERSDVADWLKANETPLAVAVEASKRSHFYWPLVSPRTNGKSEGLIGATLTGLTSMREIAVALCARAMLRVGEQRYDDAWQDLLACHRLGRLCGKGGTLIEGLVGFSIDGAASAADVGFLDGAKVDAKKLKQCMADLQALPRMPPLAEKINSTERFWFLETVMLMDRDGVGALDRVVGGKHSSLEKAIAKALVADVQWDQALLAANKAYDRLNAAMSHADRATRLKEVNDLDRDVRKLKAEMFEPGELFKRLVASKSLAEAKGKLLGDVMITLFMPAVVKIQDSADRNVQVQANLQTAFALAAYKIDHGAYPKSLDALAPKFLAQPPLDLLTGKPLVYRPSDAGFVFYSLGINAKDDAGREYEDFPPGDDVVVRLPVVVRKRE